MAKRMRWQESKRNPAGYEQAAPGGEKHKEEPAFHPGRRGAPPRFWKRRPEPRIAAAPPAPEAPPYVPPEGSGATAGWRKVQRTK